MAPKLKLEIVNFEKFKRDIIEAVSLEELPKIFRSIAPDIKEFVYESYIESFYRTDTVRGLLGEFAGSNDLDLEAQFGLTPGLGLIAVREMVFAIKDSLDIAGIAVRKNGVSFNISFKNLSEQLRLNVRSGSYNSNENYINWLDWLLDGSSEVLNYRIQFGSRLRRSSRSGRAIMVPGGSWSVQSLGGVSRFGNFLIEPLNDPQFQIQVNNEIAKKIEEAF